MQMDKKNQKDKVGADGLTKKERRALKVQGRQTDDNKAELKNIKANPRPNYPEKNELSKKDSGISIKEKTQIPDEIISGIEQKSSIESKLSDKEKRKLEWEKTLAEKKNQLNKSDSDAQGLSKAEQKAKRRELQEAQRLAKLKSDPQNSKNIPKSNEGKANPKITSESRSEIPRQVKSKVPNESKKSPNVSKTPLAKKCLHGNKVKLLNHLYIGDSKSFEFEDSVCLPNIHPAFIQLGIQYSTKTIMGSNARCISLLSALTHLIRDLRSPPEQEFCRFLESVLQNSSDYLQKCRPMAVSMINALRLFKLQLTQIDTNIPDDDKKQKLIEFVDTYIKDQVMTAGKAISMKVFDKISNGDIILTYSCSSLISQILVEAFHRKKQFKVIVVDSRPLCEGREMLRRLTQVGIECTYIFINALGYVMSTVTKVLLGAHALLTNGYVMSRTGTAQVALVAQAHNKPVLVCCETYKFSERVQTDSLVYNEIGDPDSLLKIDSSDKPSPFNSWRESKLTPLNILYDVTPPDLVTAVVTELAILPCTSVPVVLRIKPTEI